MSKPILYLARLGGLGGGETTLLANLRALDRAQFSPRVICGRDGPLAAELRAQNIPVEVIPFRAPYFKRGVFPVLSLALVPRLLASWRARPIALLHCNDLEAAYYGAPLAKCLRIPTVWTCHGWWMMERGWKSAFVEKFLDAIVTPTQHIKQTLLDINPRLLERIRVIPFGVDTREFSPQPRDESARAEFQIGRDAPLVTILARFQSVKGHAVFLDAAPHILDAFPTARFLFVGGAEFNTRDAQETRDEIYARVAAHERLRAAVVFAGFRRDIPRLLNASDLLVCPSWFETFGMALVEAMACGVPVVSTNVGGPSETVINGETGFLVPPRDPNALGARVNQLLADSALRKNFGIHARARVEKHFALDKSVDALQTLYREILK